MRRMLITVMLLALGAIALGAVSASSQTTVRVTLSEYKVEPNKSSIKAQRVTFVATNRGTVEHELELVKWGRSLGSVKMKENKASFDHDLEIGEVEGIEPGETKRFTVNVGRGSYVLLCNEPGHYQLGQRVRFRATR